MSLEAWLANGWLVRHAGSAEGTSYIRDAPYEEPELFDAALL